MARISINPKKLSEVVIATWKMLEGSDDEEEWPLQKVTRKKNYKLKSTPQANAFPLRIFHFKLYIQKLSFKEDIHKKSDEIKR